MEIIEINSVFGQFVVLQNWFCYFEFLNPVFQVLDFKEFIQANTSSFTEKTQKLTQI